MKLKVPILGLLSLLLGFSQLVLNATEAVAFADKFDSYQSPKDILEIGGWESDRSEGGCLNPSVVEDQSLSSGRTILLSPKSSPSGQDRNGFISHPFPSTKEGTKVRLSVDMLHSSEGGAQAAGLFDDTGAKGYYVFWRAPEGIAGGEIRIQKVEGSEPVAWNASGKVMATFKNIGHGSTDRPLAKMLLEIEPASGLLTLSVDGSVVGTYTDADPIKSFGRVVLRGGQGGYFDNVQVSSE